MTYPRSPYDQESGLVYFPRMLDKIRLYLKGELAEDYHQLRGNGFDGHCCHFLKVDYSDVEQKVEEGLSDAEVFAWCLENGRKPDEADMAMYNDFMKKRGWRDSAAEFLDRMKTVGNVSDRDDIATLFDAIDYDEDRLE